MIITIGRQFGSGGREIGEKVAKLLGYTFYDKEILTMAAEESGFSPAAMEHYDEKPTGSLIYSLYMTGAATSDNLPLNQQLAFAQFNVIRKVAQNDNCVIVGRCADYILREKKNLLTVFLHAPLENRVDNVMKTQGISSRSLAEKTIRKQDKARADYYNFFTHKKWGEAGSAMMSLDTSMMSHDKLAELIAGTVTSFLES
ncbi:MAG: cytidylate kinase-like family protein [Oscillospiraceae bacterium]|nr:cytidylate kinase-like family protein [Oscillospiraceae bacterium]